MGIFGGTVICTRENSIFLEDWFSHQKYFPLGKRKKKKNSGGAPLVWSF